MDNDSKSTLVSGLEGLGVLLLIVMVVVAYLAILVSFIKTVFRCSENTAHGMSVVVTLFAIIGLFIYNASPVQPVVVHHTQHHSVSHLKKHMKKNLVHKIVHASKVVKVQSNIQSNIVIDPRADKSLSVISF